MSATRYKRPHVDIFICIEMRRERNQGIIKNTRYKSTHMKKLGATKVSWVLSLFKLLVDLVSIPLLCWGLEEESGLVSATLGQL